MKKASIHGLAFQNDGIDLDGDVSTLLSPIHTASFGTAVMPNSASATIDR